MPAGRLAFRLIFLASALLAFPSSAKAQTYFVAPTGSDGNDCLSASTPCLTMQRAADLISDGKVHGIGTIRLARGTYSAGISIVYYKVVTVIGDCDDPSAVTVKLSKGRHGFMAQDYAIIGLNCVSIEATDPGSAGLMTRQYAIMDYKNVRFGPMPGGVHISIQEASKANCLGDYEIYGSATHHVVIAAQSQFFLGGATVSLPKPLEFSAFVSVALRSLFQTAGAKFAGPGMQGTKGLQYVVEDSTLIMSPTVFPGAGKKVGPGGVVK